MFIRILLVLCVIVVPISAIADDLVRGHWKDTDRDGIKDTWVDPYYRSNRNNSTYDNYSTKGNTNPYTGEKGHVDPYKDYYDYKPKTYKGY